MQVAYFILPLLLKKKTYHKLSMGRARPHTLLANTISGDAHTRGRVRARRRRRRRRLCHRLCHRRRRRRRLCHRRHRRRLVCK